MFDRFCPVFVFVFAFVLPGPGLISAGKRSVEIEDDDVTALHPNLKMVGHDKAHSFRRVLKRPYAADAVLERLMENHCLGKDSMVQVISNSADFRCWFEHCVKAQSASKGTEGFGDRVRNLKAAKHRFESVSTPLGRMLLYLPAFLMTCQKRKKDKAGQLARQYLEDLTQEQLVQLALLADAGDEGLLLVRAMDHETLDAAEISTQVTAFIDRITVLFQHRAALQSGYTQHILSLIEQKPVCIFLPNAVRKFGEVDDDVLNRCLERMRSWSRLAIEVLRTEFPSHSLFNSMQIFSLKAERQFRDSDCADDHFLRLAQVFGVNAGALRDQLLRHISVAEQVMREGGLKSRDAWERTMQRLGKTGLPSDHLGPVICRYIAWQVARRTQCALNLFTNWQFNFWICFFATRVLKPGFDQRDWARLLKDTRCNFTRSVIWDDKLQVDQGDADKGEQDGRRQHHQGGQALISRLCPRRACCENIWTFCFAVVLFVGIFHPNRVCAGWGRKRREFARIDKNVKRSSVNGDTMTAWLSKRRKVVQETVNGMGDLNYIEDEGDLQYWSESHQKELEFQQGKALKSKVEAYNFNGLLDHEITDCLKEAAEGLAEKNRQHDKEMVAERRKSQIADARMTMTIDWSQLAGKVWVASDLGCGQELETLLH